jgi:hypothetical protein
MAQVTYTGQLIYPTSEILSNFSYNYTCATIFNNDVSPSTITEYLTSFKGVVESNYGGTLSFTVTTEGSNTIVDVTWTGEEPACFVLSFGVNAASSVAYYTTFALSTTTPTVIVCDTCQDITRSACEDGYTFVAGLTPSTVYYVVIENNRNKRYVQQVTTDGSGDFAIDAAAPEFPIGFFIPEQFKYTIKVYSDSTLINQQDLTVGSTIYQCITLGFVNTVTTTASANFGVDFLIDDYGNYIVDDLGNTFSV